MPCPKQRNTNKMPISFPRCPISLTKASLPSPPSRFLRPRPSPQPTNQRREQLLRPVFFFLGLPFSSSSSPSHVTMAPAPFFFFSLERSSTCGVESERTDSRLLSTLGGGGSAWFASPPPRLFCASLPAFSLRKRERKKKEKKKESRNERAVKMVNVSPF